MGGRRRGGGEPVAELGEGAENPFFERQFLNLEANELKKYKKHPLRGDENGTCVSIYTNGQNCASRAMALRGRPGIVPAPSRRAPSRGGRSGCAAAGRKGCGKRRCKVCTIDRAKLL